jgi:hypothetical protein
MFSNLILRLSWANIVVRHSEKELERKSASLYIEEDQIFSNLILGLSWANVVVRHGENELERKSASLDIAEDQMFSNLILKLSLASVGIGHSDNELERLERDEYVMNGFGVGSQTSWRRFFSHDLDY